MTVFEARVEQIRSNIRDERRMEVPATIEVVEERADGGLKLRGTAIVFDSWSEPIAGVFRERVKRGAMRKILGAGEDIRLEYNHDSMPMASTGSGTMRAKETPRGVEWEAELVPTTLSRDVALLVRAGVLTKMSFAFRVAPDAEDWAEGEDGMPECTIREFRAVPEFSIVKEPAYTATSVTTGGSDEPTSDSRVAVPESQEHRGGDEQQPDDNGDSDGSSTQPSVNNQGPDIRSWLEARNAAQGVVHNEPCTQGSSGGRF